MLQSNEPNIFAREIFCGISLVGTGLKKKRAVCAQLRHLEGDKSYPTD
jgi:hypothetical protein